MSSRVITFHFTLSDGAGQVIDSTRDGEPFSFLEGGQQILPGLEKGLQGLQPGEKKKINLPAKEAFGQRDEKRIVDVPLENLPKKDVQVGDMFLAGREDHSPKLTVVGLTKTHAKLDGNHPLAGKDLTFEVEVTEVRDATPEELDHGHAHGPGGAHHH